MKPKMNHMEQKRNYLNIDFLIGLILAIIVIGVTFHFSIEAINQQTRCLESIAEKYPGVECGSAQFIYCEWQNKTYNVVVYQESEYWCDLVEKDTSLLYEEYNTNLWIPITAVIIIVTIVGIIGLLLPDKTKRRIRK